MKYKEAVYIYGRWVWNITSEFTINEAYQYKHRNEKGYGGYEKCPYEFLVLEAGYDLTTLPIPEKKGN